MPRVLLVSAGQGAFVSVSPAKGVPWGKTTTSVPSGWICPIPWTVQCGPALRKPYRFNLRGPLSPAAVRFAPVGGVSNTPYGIITASW